MHTSASTRDGLNITNSSRKSKPAEKPDDALEGRKTLQKIHSTIVGKQNQNSEVTVKDTE